MNYYKIGIPKEKYVTNFKVKGNKIKIFYAKGSKTIKNGEVQRRSILNQMENQAIRISETGYELLEGIQNKRKISRAAVLVSGGALLASSLVVLIKGSVSYANYIVNGSSSIGYIISWANLGYYNHKENEVYKINKYETDRKKINEVLGDKKAGEELRNGLNKKTAKAIKGIEQINAQNIGKLNHKQICEISKNAYSLKPNKNTK